MEKNPQGINWLFQTPNGIVLIVLIAATIVAAGVFWSDAGRARVLQFAERIGLYREPEHELVAVRDEAGNVLYWTCTMHPWVKAEKPGQCPICGMDLVPVRRESTAMAASTPQAGHEGHGAGMPQPQPETESTPEAPAGGPSNLFTISPQRQQLIGVQFTEAARRTLTKTIRTVGRIELDERRTAQIHTKISGWIEQTFVDFTWQHVAKGDPLFTIYSPELVSAQEEYLLALKAAEQLGKDTNPFPAAAASARSLVESARGRLQLWDVPPELFAELERTRKVERTLTFYSPASGHVVERNAYPQTRVMPEMTLYTIADHSNVWVFVDIYENEIRFVQLGQRATMTVPAYPGETFRGTVSYIDPHFQMDTRTLKVRLEFSNSDLRLKPGMYADMKLEIPLGARLVIAKSAVLRTGEQDMVFVDRGAGQMEVRLIRLGTEVGDAYEVLSGLRPGERVVAAANFLVDAESQVQGAIATWQGQEGNILPEAARPSAERAQQRAQSAITAEILEPQPAKVGRNMLRVLVKDASGMPVENAEVEVTLLMPAMPGMAPMSVGTTLRGIGQGQYTGTVEIPMAFSWQTTITVRKEGQVIGTVRTTLLAR
ncbi:MAG: efflux RND transporter periplasmic adaptor subunit [Acidobacteria bacterium]|nr:efflux RND transporter periplasmic adaptor subunit [Acidobacteriota bacterium]